jgi:hypothetical protein
MRRKWPFSGVSRSSHETALERRRICAAFDVAVVALLRSPRDRRCRCRALYNLSRTCPFRHAQIGVVTGEQRTYRHSRRQRLTRFTTGICAWPLRRLNNVTCAKCISSPVARHHIVLRLMPVQRIACTWCNSQCTAIRPFWPISAKRIAPMRATQLIP